MKIVLIWKRSTKMHTWKLTQMDAVLPLLLTQMDAVLPLLPQFYTVLVIVLVLVPYSREYEYTEIFCLHGHWPTFSGNQKFHL